MTLPALSTRPQKHSLTLHGHRTSVSLEPDFWAAFCGIAAARGQSISALAAQIDDARAPDVGLASALRVFVLRDLLQKRRADLTVSGGAASGAA